MLTTPRSNLARRKVVMQTPSRWAANLDVVLASACLRAGFGAAIRLRACVWGDLRRWAGPVMTSSGVSGLGPVQEKAPVLSMR